MPRVRWTLLVPVALLLWLSGAHATPNPDLAIAVRRSVARAVLSSSRGFILRDLVRDTTIKKWTGSAPLVLKSGKEGIAVGKLGNFSHVSVEPLVQSILAVDGQRYRGRFRIEEDSYGRINVINVLDVENYLKGVIPAEMLVSSHVDALKAQAVVARTFALKQARKSRRQEGYDLTSDTASQVYRGLGGEEPRASKAVDITRGEVVHIRNKLVDTFYHQACGGRTQNNEDVWGGRALSHLRAVDCSYCAAQYSRQGYGDYHWTYQVSNTDLQVKLLERGVNAGKILDIQQSLQECGRAKSFSLTTTEGDIELGSSKLRTLVGPGIIRSSFYRLANSQAFRELSGTSRPSNPMAEANIRSIIGSYLEDSNSKVIEFEGTGSGHGVGLCQWGARRMAEMGRSHIEILRHYYQSVSVGPLLPEFTGDE